MKNNETKEVKAFAEPDKDGDVNAHVKNIRKVRVNQSQLESFKNKVIENKAVDDTTKNVAKDMVAAVIKNAIAKERGDVYKHFANMDYDNLMKSVKMVQREGSNVTDLEVTVPQTPETETMGIYGTHFEISPNSFWSNITNILNKVSVGNNEVGTGKSFNAYTFFRAENLVSGEAKLITQGYSVSGTCMLDQNTLVPNSTQEPPGYQASLGVFINVDNPENVGGGKGIGLFNMYSAPINVIKLAVTEPQQFSEMVRIFYRTAANTKAFTLWMITTMDLLSSINNYVIDTNNTNTRDCLNGTLFPAIEIMETPTTEFNLGIPTTVVSGSTTTTMNYNNLMNPTFMSGITSSTRGTQIQSEYLVDGSNPNPRIQTSRREDIHLIITPRFYTILKSGVLSELYHYEFQRLEEYVLPENIHLLYKKINIPTGYMNVADSAGKYPYQECATLGDTWIPDNAIICITKGSDSNDWSAQYGDVWTTEMQNNWGAGMVKTAYLHYAIYGGTIPWSNGCIFYFKNLLADKAGATQPTVYDFTLGKTITQSQADPIA